MCTTVEPELWAMDYGWYTMLVEQCTGSCASLALRDDCNGLLSAATGGSVPARSVMQDPATAVITTQCTCTLGRRRVWSRPQEQAEYEGTEYCSSDYSRLVFRKLQQNATKTVSKCGWNVSQCEMMEFVSQELTRGIRGSLAYGAE
jgi:hypothetical protein